MEVLHNFEFLILDFVQEHIKNPFFDLVMPKITFLGDAGLIWIVICVILLLKPKYRKHGIRLGIGILSSFLLTSFILKPIFARTRPFNIRQAAELLISEPGGYSFPSGHTAVSFCAAAIILSINKKAGIAAIALASLIAFSRMYLYVHFPTDIIGGILVGVFAAKAVNWLFRRSL